MLEQIQQAETAIKSGDTRTGFQILRDVLATNPNSERAWWVMSGLVPREQRAHCLNQVLRINPNNQMARETLENLRPEKPETEPTETEKPSAPQGKGTLGGYQTWLFAQRSRIFLTLLGEEELISGETEPKNLARIRAAINKGELPDTLFKKKTVIPLESITRVRQIVSSLQVHYQVKGSEKSIRLELENEGTTNVVMSALENQLAPSFSLQAKPMKTTIALVISLVLTISAAALTAFLYGKVNEIFGPIGAVLIGGVLILISLGISAWLLLKPPAVTELRPVEDQ